MWGDREEYYGPAHNPNDLARTPSGSSEIGISLKLASPSGIPMIVRHRSVPVIRWASASHHPHSTNQMTLPIPEAMEVVTREIELPVGGEFRRLLDELRIGTAMEEALQRAADRVRVPDFRFFVVSLLLQSQTGGGIAETLSNLSAIIRQRKALRLKARALTAEAQTSAMIMAAMPFVAGAGLFLINRELMLTMLTDPRGRFLLGLAGASLVLGIVTMKVLITKNLR